MTPRERVIRVLLRILANPYRYTRRDLANYFKVSKDAMDEYVQAIQGAGLNYEQDKHHRCAVLPDKAFKELQYLQSLSESEIARVGSLINQYIGGRDGLYLNKKLESLYDFQRLGIRALRKPALELIDRLELAKKKKLQVVLEQYRSNSNDISDRIVEPFHIDPEINMLQAYEPKKEDSRHFRLSRIHRVRFTDKPWSFEKLHTRKYTDAFRIANNDQVMVHLLLDVYAYNILLETYPQAKGHIEPGAEPKTYDFQAKVNAGFLGLTNFILSNAQHIEILSPDSLKEQVKAEAKKIFEKF